MRFVAALMSLALATTVQAGVARSPADATLRCVWFADAHEGWAAGDDGAIWHTIDGGTSWEKQVSGVRGSLRAISFINPYTGWIVGRDEIPHQGSTGIVLFTSDGGITWTRRAEQMLPGLHSVKFFDDRHGMVTGDGSDAFPSGVFETVDGGRTWSALPGARQPGWLAADFSDARTGALAGSGSSLATLRDRVVAKSDIDSLGGRSVQGIRLYNGFAAAVGQGGLILISRDTAGARWSISEPKCVSRPVLASCDFTSIHILGEHLWVVGRPGSIVFHSGDYGKTWDAHRTGQHLPLHAVHFHDAKTGWAVGDLGTILATRDGGKSWSIQRRGGHRAAMLHVHASPETVCFEPIATHGGNEGYLCAALCVTSPEQKGVPLSSANGPQRWSHAVRRAGGAAGESLWAFPIAGHLDGRPAKEILAQWDALHDGKAGDALLRHLVMAIRIWQPEVIVTDPSGTEDAILDVTVRQAFHHAADPKAFPDQIEELGLQPWTAKKLYGLAAAAPSTAECVTLDSTSALSRCGDSARDLATEALAALFPQAQALPTSRAFHLRESRLPEASKHSTLMQGITLAPGGTARRELPAVGAADAAGLELREKSTQEKRNIEALASPTFKELGGPDRMLGQADKMLKRLPPDQGAAAAFALATGYARMGQWLMAREMFLLLVDRYPNNPLTFDAYRWLVRFSSSSEARRRYELGQFVQMATIDVVTTPSSGTDKSTIRQTGGTETVTTKIHQILASQETARAWYQAALAFEPKVATLGPVVAEDPAMKLCLLSAHRSLGKPELARDWCATYSGKGPVGAGDLWREVAASEVWLTNRTTRAPRPIAYCRTAPRPTLDGKLDDDCWKDVKPISLTTAGGNLASGYVAQAWLAFDAEHLYIAVRCEHPRGLQVPLATGRKHDSDLRAHDRVSILLDMDRDFQTCYHLQVDQRGCLAEDCWGDSTWNPKWYVASASDETSWTAEIAIPRTELTGDGFSLAKVWAMNVVRIVPGRGIQAWSHPADVKPRPEAMGLMIFTDK